MRFSTTLSSATSFSPSSSPLSTPSSSSSLPSVHQDLVTQYQTQNQEIIKANVRLKEKITFLEAVISKLQDENMQIRREQLRQQNLSDSSHTSDSGEIDQVQQRMANKKKKTKRKMAAIKSSSSSSNSSSRSNSNSSMRIGKRHFEANDSSSLFVVELTKKEVPKIESNDTTDNAAATRKTRRSTRKPVSYTLPSIRSKLRKGDPFTFGNTITE
ncbi:hypothetical protein BDF20DRAFT_909643 [Mycotypha africana]|uniref:uncharacterized protein n=1 Tax=Mycotypha africana TaxID=64632 RepID=UPI0022FFF8CD|nr:uncharacterized protein BDF20DRAFT_909643 [Mycotypha africana]KAI8991937.1 hypothetical protein BDF20DRAFT_909643 [Mycotypha africana]